MRSDELSNTVDTLTILRGTDCPRHAKRSACEEAGFTIIELLTVTVLLAMLSAILYSSITAVLNGRELVAAQKQTLLTAEHIFSRLTSDLSAREAVTLENDSDDNSGSQSTPTIATGFQGFGLKSFLRSKNEKKRDADSDTLEFVTQSYPTTVVSKTRNFGIVQVRYRVENAPNDIDNDERRREVFRLLRDEMPAGVTDKKTREAHRTTQILSDSLSEFNVRFLKQGTWTDEWNTTSGRAFPEAVEITLGLSDQEGSIHRFRTAIALSKQQASN